MRAPAALKLHWLCFKGTGLAQPPCHFLARPAVPQFGCAPAEQAALMLRSCWPLLTPQSLPARYIADRASRGLRSLGVAQSADGGATWELVGLISLLDPPRPDSGDTVKLARSLGVEVGGLWGGGEGRPLKGWEGAGAAGAAPNAQAGYPWLAFVFLCMARNT